MEAARATLPDLDALDDEALKGLVREQHAQLLSQEAEIEHLKLLLAQLQRQQFGRICQNWFRSDGVRISWKENQAALDEHVFTCQPGRPFARYPLSCETAPFFGPQV